MLLNIDREKVEAVEVDVQFAHDQMQAWTNAYMEAWYEWRKLNEDIAKEPAD